MDLQKRIELLIKLGNYIQSNETKWIETKLRAVNQNSWFIDSFVDTAIKNIAENFLQKEKLIEWTEHYNSDNNQFSNKKVGIVMAGNIPLVGFHDFLCAFISGYKQVIKASSKDNILIKHLVSKLIEWESSIQEYISFEENLKGCDAYIATGSNNSSRYFEYYFNKYPSIIRKNRTSVAILDGTETESELNNLSNDIQLYFGLGCRNVTKIYVPKDNDFVPLLDSLKQFGNYMDFHKYKNNYDYQLAILLMSEKYYMTDGSLLLVEDANIFSPISQLNYEFYDDKDVLISQIQKTDSIQCIVGNGFIDFGKAQAPTLYDYADGVDTMQFFKSL